LDDRPSEFPKDQRADQIDRIDRIAWPWDLLETGVKRGG